VTRVRQFLVPAAAALVAIAIAATVIAFVAFPIAALAVFVAPFIAALVVLTLPGYAIFAAISPRSVAASERILFSLGLSFIATALGAIVLNLTPLGVVPFGWRVLLGGVTAFGLIVVVWHGRTEEHRPSAPNIERFPALLVAVAIIIVVGATVAARAGADADPSSAVTQLWMLPGPAGSAQLEVGLTSADGGRFRLEVWRGKQRTRVWSVISLSPGQLWRQTLPIPAGAGPVEARLYPPDGSGRQLRVVSVTPRSG
jgi:uncharacterized membrane protein